MPARDLYHDAVRNGLIKDGWVITRDPYDLTFGLQNAHVDLEAEPMIAAEKGHEKIAVAVEPFLGASELCDFTQAIGRYAFYGVHLAREDAERMLILAVPAEVVRTLFNEPITGSVQEELAIRVLAFDPVQEVIESWKN